MDVNRATAGAWLLQHQVREGIDFFSTTSPPSETAAILGLPAWVVAVVLCILGSLLTVGGLALQKQASSKPGRRIGSIVLSTRWLTGLILGNIAPIPMQIWAYSIAPMSLTTPLSGVTVVLNMAIAHGVLGERLRLWPDVPASLLILLGTGISTLAGDHTEVDYDFRTLLGLVGQFEFLVALAVLFAAMVLSFGYMTKRHAHIEESARSRPSNPSLHHVLLPALVAAGSGCFTNIVLKALGELVKSGAFAFECVLCLVVAVLPAAMQLNFVNKGLALYQQTVFVPVYNALLVLTNTFYGLIFYREYVNLLKHRESCAFFAVGVLLVIAGVILFSKRQPEKSDKDTPDARTVSMLENGVRVVDE